MWKIREIQDKVTNVVMNYTEVESKVREATNDDQWGPHGSVMGELAKYTYTYENFPEVMGMLWKRMLLEKKNWRRVYKSLLVLSYLLKNGSERVVQSARDHLYDMRQLENYQHIDELGKDQGLNIRHKVKEILEMVQDDSRLRDERKRAKKNKDKYVGMSNDLIEDSFYSDRYNKDARSPRTRGSDDFQQPSKFQQIKETLDTIRPGGKRDYSNYNIQGASRNAYKDEPENGVEAGEDSDNDDYKYKSTPRNEFKDDDIDDDDFQPRKNTPSATSPASRKTPSKKVDLGAAAKYTGGGSSTTSPSAAGDKSDSGFADFSSFSSGTNEPPKGSNDLADLMGGPLSEPSGGNTDLFGDFSAPAPAAPVVQQQSSTATDFANFESFGSLNQASAPSSASNDLLGMSATPNLMSQPMQPSGNLMVGQPSQQNNMFMQPTNQMMAPMQSTNQMMQPMQSTNGMMQPMQSANQMQPMSTMGMQPRSQGMMTPQKPMNQTLGTPQSQNTLWANTGVDISLDSLSPGASRQKPAMPSMNQMQGGVMAAPMGSPYGAQPQQQSYAQNMNMMNRGMTNLNFNNTQQQQTPMMRGGAQPMGGMQMNMQSGTMGQMNNTNFAQFKAS